MSKFVKGLIEKDIKSKLEGVDAVAVVNPRGIDATKNNLLRRKLHEKGLRMTVVKNTLAKRATAGSKIQGFESLLDGPSAVVYGKASISQIARTLMEAKKTNDKLEFRGVFFDGEVYAGDKGVEQVSKLPTREEAIGLLVASILGPGKKLGGIFKGQAGKVASLIKAIEEKREKEGGEAAPSAAAPEAAPAA